MIFLYIWMVQEIPYPYNKMVVKKSKNPKNLKNINFTSYSLKKI